MVDMTTPHSPGTRLTMISGIATAVVAIGHVVVTTTPHWSGWLAGELRDRTASVDSFRAFWAQPGGFAAALLILSVLLVRMARRRETPPVSIGVIMVGWIGLCIGLLGPSTGFTLGMVPAGLILAAGLRGSLGGRA